MPAGVYERNRSTHICTNCGREYQATKGERCPDCVKAKQAEYNRKCYDRKKEKLKAFRESVGLG
jgi:predicted  nucleic acid-binding Zn-ribbon protein